MTDILKPIQHLKTRVEFEKFLNPETNYFIYFTATWCTPCHVAKPKIFKYLTTLKATDKNFEFLLLDADISRDIVRHLKVKAFPTIMCVINNDIEDICIGGGDNDLKEFFNSSYKKLK